MIDALSAVPTDPEELANFQAKREYIDANGNYQLCASGAKYYEPGFIQKIIDFRKSGLSPIAACKAAGVGASTHHDWHNKYKSDNPPRPLVILFRALHTTIPSDQVSRSLCVNGRPPRFMDEEVRNAIIKYKAAGLPDEEAFKHAGISATTYKVWKRQLQEIDCPLLLTELFDAVDKTDATVMGNVLGVLYEEAVGKKNWKAADLFLMRRWGDKFGPQKYNSAAKNKDSSGPTLNLDALTKKEQKEFIRMSKKAKIDEDDVKDESVKLLISLPHNGRD